MIYVVNRHNGKSDIFPNNVDPIRLRGLALSFVFVDGEISDEVRRTLEICTVDNSGLEERNEEEAEFSVFFGGKSQTYRAWIPARYTQTFRGILDGIKNPLLKRR